MPPTRDKSQIENERIQKLCHNNSKQNGRFFNVNIDLKAKSITGDKAG